MIDMMRDVAEKDCWEEWRRICQPTLVVGGDESRPGNAVLKKMAKEIPNGTYVSIAGAGHDVHLDRTEAWRSVLLHFVTRQ
jgi:pimeloyl-ACP methyl ester carboxylesterase